MTESVPASSWQSVRRRAISFSFLDGDIWPLTDQIGGSGVFRSLDWPIGRKTGTATNSRLWNWMAVPGLPLARHSPDGIRDEGMAFPTPSSLGGRKPYPRLTRAKGHVGSSRVTRLPELARPPGTSFSDKPSDRLSKTPVNSAFYAPRFWRRSRFARRNSTTRSPSTILVVC